MAYEAIVDRDGKPVAREVRAAGAVWRDVELALGDVVRFVASDDEVRDLRIGALELTKSGKLRKAKDYQPEPMDDDEAEPVVPVAVSRPKKEAKPKKTLTKPKKVR